MMVDMLIVNSKESFQIVKEIQASLATQANYEEFTTELEFIGDIMVQFDEATKKLATYQLFGK